MTELALTNLMAIAELELMATLLRPAHRHVTAHRGSGWTLSGWTL